MRYVVILSRDELDGTATGDALGIATYTVVVGPFRSKVRALHRASVIRRLAATYEDPEGITGPDNALDVRVEPVHPGKTSARAALDELYS